MDKVWKIQHALDIQKGCGNGCGKEI